MGDLEDDDEPMNEPIKQKGKSRINGTLFIFNRINEVVNEEVQQEFSIWELFFNHGLRIPLQQ